MIGRSLIVAIMPNKTPIKPMVIAVSVITKLNILSKSSQSRVKLEKNTNPIKANNIPETEGP